MTKKSLLLLLICSPISFGTPVSQEVMASGTGTSDTKLNACQIAMNAAKNEAFTFFSSTIQSSIEKIESNSGVAHYSSNQLISKSSLHIKSKSERIDFDERTGMITCSIEATFTQNTHTTDQHSEIEFINNESSNNPGMVFCSKLMNMCFREYYYKKENEFGIQIVYSSNNRNSLLFFNKIKLWDSTSNQFVLKSISTTESFNYYIKSRYDEIGGKCRQCPISLTVSSITWDDKYGYNNSQFKLRKIDGRYKEDIGIFTQTPEISEEQINEIDKKLSQGLNIF